MSNRSGAIAVFRAGDIAIVVGASCETAAVVFAEDDGPFVFKPSTFAPGLSVARIGWSNWDGEFGGDSWIVSHRRPSSEEIGEFIRTGAVTIKEVAE